MFTDRSLPGVWEVILDASMGTTATVSVEIKAALLTT